MIGKAKGMKSLPNGFFNIFYRFVGTIAEAGMGVEIEFQISDW